MTESPSLINISYFVKQNVNQGNVKISGYCMQSILYTQYFISLESGGRSPDKTRKHAVF